MPAWVRPIVVGVVLLSPAPAVADDPLTAAANAEAAGRWEQAAGHYLRAVQLGQGTPDVRAKADHCLRRAAQARRLRDPNHLRFAAALEPADALTLYADALAVLSAAYPDRDRCRPDVLFAHGLDELDRALADPAFRAAHLSPDADVPWFRAAATGVRANLLPTPKGCRQAALDLLPLAARRLGLSAGPLVLELLCGACGGLDPHTVYVPPDPAPARSPGPTVPTAELLPSGVGLLRVTAFRDSTPDEIDQSILRLRDKGPLRAVVLDLRDNPGGSFAAAVRAAERFVPTGVLASTAGRHPSFAGRVFSSDSGSNAWDVPAVLLVDGRTMSAAEVFAAALKGTGRATVVGTPTFGKGLVQVPFELTRQGAKPVGKLIVTVARVTGPTGEPLHGVGLRPDRVEADPAKQLATAVEQADGR